MNVPLAAVEQPNPSQSSGNTVGVLDHLGQSLGHSDDGQLLDVVGKGSLVPQVMGHMVASTGQLRAVNGNRPPDR